MPYLLIERARNNESISADEKDFVRVHQTNVLNESVSPMWTNQRLKLQSLCNSNRNLPIRFSIYNFREHGDHELYGQVVTKVGAL